MRPRVYRKIRFNPKTTYYKPAGIPMANIEEVDLSLDEIEAIRLVDVEELSMEKGAKKMKISKSTFHRLVESAHKKITKAIIEGKAIKIHKLIDFNYPKRVGYQRPGRGFGFGRRRYRGRSNQQIK